MAKMTSRITNSGTIGGVKRSFTQTVSKDVVEILDSETNFNESSSGEYKPYLIHTLDPSSKGAMILPDFKQMSFYNSGEAVAEVMFQLNNYDDDTSNADRQAAASGNHLAWGYVSWLIRPGEYITFPNPRAVIYNEEDSSDPESAAAAALVNAGSDRGPTDSKGYATSATYFGDTDTNGIVPGSFCVNFYMAGYQELGMTNTFNKKARQLASSSTGLAVNTAYEFKLALDGGSAVRISFTTHTSNVKWGGTNGVLAKINATLKGFHDDGTLPSRATMHITKDGDIRVTSGSRLATSAVALTAGTTGTAEFFGTGNIPPVGSSDGSDGINAATAAALENGAKLGFSTTSTTHILRDNGNGILHRPLGGTGTIDYDENGTVTLKNCPPNAHFRLKYFYNSAHSGDFAYHASTGNGMYRIFARSVSPMIETKIRVLAFN